jgi:hypothetical protein
VQATANAGTASGAIKLEAVAAPSGVAARIAAFVQAGGDTQFRRAGWAIDVTEGPPGVFTSRFVVEANQFVVSDNGATPFTVIGGVTYIQNAVIQDAAINTARIENNAVTSIVAATDDTDAGVFQGSVSNSSLQNIISVSITRTANTVALINASMVGTLIQLTTPVPGTASLSEDENTVFRYTIRRSGTNLFTQRAFGAWGFRANNSLIIDPNSYLSYSWVDLQNVSGAQTYVFAANRPLRLKTLSVYEFKR